MDGKKINTMLLIKSGFWYTVSSFLTRAMVFITMPVFTRIMTKTEYGNFSIYCNWQAILLIICGIEVYATLNRARFDFTKEKELDGYITSSLVLSTVITSIICLLYLCFPFVFEKILLIDKKYMFMMFAYLFTYPALAMFQAKQRITYKYKLCAAISFGLAIGSSLLSLALVIMMKSDRLFGRIVGQYVFSIVVGLIFYLYFMYRSRQVSVRAWKYALRIGLPMVFSYIGSQILLSSDSIILKHMCSAEEVSYISVTHTTSHIMLILVQALNTAWAPWFYDMLKMGNKKKIREIYQIYLWLVIGLTFVVLLIGPEIISVLGGLQYKESIYVLPAYMMCGTFSVLTAQFGNLETYYKKPEYAAVLTAIISALNVILNILGVKLLGYRAVCYTTVICQLILIGLHYFVTQKMEIRSLLPIKKMIVALCITVIIIPIMLGLYQSNLIRYICILLAIIAGTIILILKHKELIIFIRKFKNKENV
ncbi:oligosaccharide flippase family protein [bacterium 210820-DFI.6.37]|nr:oligosaccharide flippase family protein [bacterium 210820-DFI.6.37]